MSPFHELVKADLDIFLNLDEIAETHAVDGEEMVCVLEDSTINGADGWRMLSEATVKLYAKTENLPKRRVRGESLYIDGVGYEVVTWNEEMGMTRVELQAKENM